MGRIQAMNFQAFDLNLLRVFDALMRERSVTRAGERVGLSQPAVSAALARLRAALDDQLFVRRGTEMAPTLRAEDLANPVREALAAMERALFGERRFDPATTHSTFTLLGADFFSTLVMPRLAARLRREAPGVRLRFLDSARGDVDRLLQEDAIDLALDSSLELAAMSGLDGVPSLAPALHKLSAEGPWRFYAEIALLAIPVWWRIKAWWSRAGRSSLARVKR